MATETTHLSLEEEAQFQQWARAMGIKDVNDPRARYDYRGYWKATRGEFGAGVVVNSPLGDSTVQRHFPDTFKQHGHPTFSAESQYSAGPFDGGRWNGDNYVPNGADLLMNSRGQSRSSSIAEALQALIQGMNGR